MVSSEIEVNGVIENSKDIQSIEAKGLRIAAFTYLFMGTLGIIVSQIANSSAVITDGIFSLISTFSTLIAIKVSSFLMKENEKYPFGYAGYELLYVLLRSFLLLIVVLGAFIDSTSRIVTYFTTGEFAQVDTNVIIIYALFISLMYIILNIHYGKYVKLTNGKSELLTAEKFNARENSFLMLGVGGSFILIGLLKFTPLKFLVPIGDAIVLFFIAALVIINTLKLFTKTISSLGGKGVGGQEKEELLSSLKETLSDEIDIIKIRIKKVGKTAFVAVDIELEGENIEKTKIKGICETIKGSVKEKYEVNHTFVNFKQ